MTLGAVVGLAAEARLARRLGMQAAIGEAGAAALVTAGVSGLVSFGIAGGLAPALAPGTIMLASAVRTAAGDLGVDAAWHARVALALHDMALPFVDGVLFAADAIVAAASDKAALHQRTNAVAVDLESHHAARAAARAGLPFLVLRAVADPAKRSLPPAALLPLDAAGGVRLPAVLAAILRQPSQLPALVALARDTQAALRALGQAGAGVSRPSVGAGE